MLNYSCIYIVASWKYWTYIEETENSVHFHTVELMPRVLRERSAKDKQFAPLEYRFFPRCDSQTTHTHLSQPRSVNIQTIINWWTVCVTSPTDLTWLPVFSDKEYIIAPQSTLIGSPASSMPALGRLSDNWTINKSHEYATAWASLWHYQRCEHCSSRLRGAASQESEATDYVSDRSWTGKYSLAESACS